MVFMKRRIYYFLRNKKININLIIYYSSSLLQIYYICYCLNVINFKKFGTVTS
jgi:hypothetical protein